MLMKILIKILLNIQAVYYKLAMLHQCLKMAAALVTRRELHLVLFFID